MVDRPTVRPLPEQLLTNPTVVEALRRHNFGVAFAAAHKCGISYQEISRATGLKADRVGLDAKAQDSYRNPRIETVERIADGLRIPGWMLGLAARDWELTQPAEPGRETKSVNRRELLQGAVAAGVVVPLAGIAEVHAQTEAALSYTGVDDVVGVEAAAERLSGGYQGRTPAETLAKLVAEMVAASPLLKLQHTRTVGADLRRAVAQLGGMAAIVLHDMGYQAEAEQWFVTAARAARDSGDRQALAWVQARRAMVPLNYGAPKTAARIAEQARRAAGGQETAAAALAASVAARAYALSGRPQEARDALRDADRIAGRLPAGEAADSWWGYCEQKHHVHRSQAWTALEDTAAARESQSEGLRLATSSGMTRSLLLMDGAVCVFRDGDPVGACGAAVEVLQRTPRRFRDGLVLRRGQELYAAVPDMVRRSTAGRAFGEALEAA